MNKFVAKRINDGIRLIEDLRKKKNPAPYADSILAAAMYNKIRIVEALIQYYSDEGMVRTKRIN